MARTCGTSWPTRRSLVPRRSSRDTIWNSPFEIEVPAAAPPTFEACIGSITWLLRGVVARKLRSDTVIEQVITVYDCSHEEASDPVESGLFAHPAGEGCLRHCFNAPDTPSGPRRRDRPRAGSGCGGSPRGRSRTSRKGDRRVVMGKDVELELGHVRLVRPADGLLEQRPAMPCRRCPAATIRPRSATWRLAGCGSRATDNRPRARLRAPRRRRLRRRRGGGAP